MISDRTIVSFHRERMNEVARAMSLKKSFWKTIVFLFGGALLLASPVFADPVDQSLAQLPAAVKDRAREMIQKGIAGEDAVPDKIAPPRRRGRNGRQRHAAA